jgi:hypothetical protein
MKPIIVMTNMAGRIPKTGHAGVSAANPIKITMVAIPRFVMGLNRRFKFAAITGTNQPISPSVVPHPARFGKYPSIELLPLLECPHSKWPETGIGREAR